jgi:hypothetical protein
MSCDQENHVSIIAKHLYTKVTLAHIPGIIAIYSEFQQARGDCDEMKFWWAVGQMLCSELFLISAVHNSII